MFWKVFALENAKKYFFVFATGWLNHILRHQVIQVIIPSSLTRGGREGGPWRGQPEGIPLVQPRRIHSPVASASAPGRYGHWCLLLAHHRRPGGRGGRRVSRIRCGFESYNNYWQSWRGKCSAVCSDITLGKVCAIEARALFVRVQ